MRPFDTDGIARRGCGTRIRAVLAVLAPWVAACGGSSETAPPGESVSTTAIESGDPDGGARLDRWHPSRLERPWRADADPTMSSFTDAELLEAYSVAIEVGRIRFEDGSATDATLLEMALRGGRWKSLLEAEYARVATRTDRWGFSANYGAVEILTALRRAQGCPDPLRVVVGGDEVLVADFLRLLTIDVHLENADVEQVSFPISHGGDYRSGRLERWRIEMWDDRGDEVPPASPSGYWWGGGMFRRDPLEPGSTWEAGIALRGRLEIEEPGVYTFRALYHDQETIAFREDLTGLVIHRSDVRTLVLEPHVTEVTSTEARDIRARIEELKGGGSPVLFTTWFYREGMTFEGEAQGPFESLYRRGWSAVPFLIDALERGEPSRSGRAWCLAALFSITGLNDPQRGGLGSYEFRCDPATPGRIGRAGGVNGGRGRGEVDPTRQDALIERWSGVREHMEVRIVD